MSGLTNFSKNDLVSIVAESFISVLDQTSAKKWERSSGEVISCATAYEAIFQCSGALEGELKIECGVDDGREIARILLGDADSPAKSGELEAEEKEAIEEFLRQVMGLVQSACSSRVGEVTIRPGELAAGEEHRGKTRLQAGCAGSNLGFTIALNAALERSCSSEAASDVQIPNERPDNLDLLMSVTLPVVMRFGEREMRLRDILELGSGAVVELNRRENDPIELLLDGKLIARGEVVVVEGSYGFRVLEVATPRERLQAVPR